MGDVRWATGGGRRAMGSMGHNQCPARLTADGEQGGQATYLVCARPDSRPLELALKYRSALPSHRLLNGENENVLIPTVVRACEMESGVLVSAVKSFLIVCCAVCMCARVCVCAPVCVGGGGEGRGIGVCLHTLTHALAGVGH